MKLSEHVTALRFLLSDESLQHREELRQRIQVYVVAEIRKVKIITQKKEVRQRIQIYQ